MQELMEKAKQLLSSGEVARVLGWRKGENVWDAEPAFFETADALDGFIYNGFCGANLSKYVIEAGKKEGKTLVFLKPCDSYSFNQLLREHRVSREKAYIVGVGCKGKLSLSQIPFDGILSISGAAYPDPAENLTVETLYGTRTLPYKSAMLERCHVCKGKEHMIYDEIIGESKDTKDADRFAEVEMIEAMSPEERFAFFPCRRTIHYCILSDENEFDIVVLLAYPVENKRQIKYPLFLNNCPPIKYRYCIFVHVTR